MEATLKCLSSINHSSCGNESRGQLPRTFISVRPNRLGFCAPKSLGPPSRLPPVSASLEKPGFLKPATNDLAGNYLPFLKPSETITDDSISNQEEQLEILRERRGMWHEYATVIPSLTRFGVTNSTIEEATGISAVEQNIIVVAAQVYGSLSASKNLSPESLSYFDVGGAEILYELRILSSSQREEAAAYIVGNRLDTKSARELARAIKDFDRRKRDEGRDAFSNSPGDCLAFALYRQSKEYKGAQEKEPLLQRGLEYATTERARSKLEAALGIVPTNPTAVQAPPKPKLPLLKCVRLSSDETSFHPVPVLGFLDDLSLDLLDSHPAYSLQGPFNLFSTSASVASWLALPSWKIFQSSKSIVGILLTERQGTKLSVMDSPDPAVLLVDLANVSVADSTLYLVSKIESDVSSLVLLPGFETGKEGLRVLGKVLLGLVPPRPEEGDDDEGEDSPATTWSL